MKNIIIEKWDEILEFLRLNYNISSASFKIWISPLSVYSVEGDCITIAIDDSNFSNPAHMKNNKQHIITQYTKPLQISIVSVIGKNFELVFELASILKENEQKAISSPQFEKKPSITAPKNIGIPLNPKYTFDTFVVGKYNDFAYSYAEQIAKKIPGILYNPFFLYGGVGLGKTHLMHSIAHYIVEHSPETKILFVTSEFFTNELIEAIRSKSDTLMQEFKEKYRNIDVLMIDDIQFIIGKDRTQEEFFNTFNALYDLQKQIIITSDKPPRDLGILNERIQSRFEMGLGADVKPPDYETRMAILRKKTELDNYIIDDSVLDYIATHVVSNIRQLEGALNKIIAVARLRKHEVTVALAEEALVDLISPDTKVAVTVESIINITAEHFNITPADIISTKKSRNIAYPRQICMYLCRELTEDSLKDIGSQLGKRDHTTVLHGINKISDDLKKDPPLQNTIDVLKKKINP